MAIAALIRWRNPLVFLLFVVSLLTVGRSSLLRDPGTYWHTVLGQRMLLTGEFVREDIFTFSRGGESWLALQWLPEAAMAAGYWLGGWDCLLLLTCCLLAWVYSRVFIRWLDCGLHPLAVVFLTAITLAASSHHFHVRPHLATLGLLAVCIRLLADIEAARKSIVQIGWLIPLFVLWTNSHGGVLAGLASLTIVVAGWCVMYVFGGSSPLKCRKDCCIALLSVVFCYAALVANPYGFDMPRAWVEIMTMRLPIMIEEHAPLDLSHFETWAVLALALLYLMTLLTVRGRWRASWLLPLIWFALAWTRVRHAPLFAIVTAVLLADIVPLSRVAEWMTPGDWFRPKVRPAGTSRVAWIAIAALLVGSFTLQCLCIPLPLAGSGWAQFSPARWPLELIPELHRLEERAAGTRILNSLGMGGFLEFHAPGLRTWIDDRCELFGNEFLEQYVETESHAPERIDDWACEHGCKFALVPTESPLGVYLARSPQWSVLARAQAATLFERLETLNDPRLNDPRLNDPPQERIRPASS